MASTGWESSDLLAKFNLLAGRPTTDAIDNPTKYGYLADGEEYVIDRIAGISAKTLYGAPAQLTTADGGYTYTFGTDGNGYPLFPLGRARIYNSLAAIPSAPLRPDFDYLDEGVRIRSTNNTPLAGPLYWYGLTPTQRISATVQPVLMPPSARMLDVIAAVKMFAESALRNAALADRMDARFEREFGQKMTMIRKHFAGGGAMGRLLAPWGAPSGALVGPL